MLLVAGVTVVACVTAVACIWQTGSHSCCCWRPLSSWWFPVVGLSAAIADVPGVTNCVAGVSAVACVPADPGVPILDVGFTYCTVEWDVSDYGYRTVTFLLSKYRIIEYRIGKFKTLSDYRISDQGLNLWVYWRTDSQRRENWWPRQGELMAEEGRTDGRGREKTLTKI